LFLHICILVFVNANHNGQDLKGLGLIWEEAQKRRLA